MSNQSESFFKCWEMQEFFEAESKVQKMNLDHGNIVFTIRWKYTG